MRRFTRPSLTCFVRCRLSCSSTDVPHGKMCEAASKRFQRTQGLPRGADWCALIIEEPVSMKLLHQVKLPLELQRGFRLFDIFFSILQINCMLVLSFTSIQKPPSLIYCELLTGMGRDALHLFCTLLLRSIRINLLPSLVCHLVMK